MFKLEDLKSTLESITPTLQKMEQLKDIPGRETAKLRKEMIKGKKLVSEISKVKPFSIFNRVNYADKNIKLKKSTEFSVPDSLASTPGLDVPMKELRTELLKDDGMQVIVVSAPGGAGKTTLIKKLCADDQVKDTFQENIFFVTVSKTPNVMVIVQRILQHKKTGVLAFQTDEAAINDLERLLKSIEQAILLVLDDVWSESVVHKFKFELPNYKILVTSRSVFPQFGSGYQLKPLNDEDAMILFRSSVTPQDGKLSIFDEVLAKKILRVCKGSPLDLTVVGRLLRGKPAAVWQSKVKEWDRGKSIFISGTELDEPFSVLDSLASTPGLDVPMKQLRKELLKDDGMQVIVVSAPGGAGKTTLIKKLCADDQVKDKFQENILFITVSKTPDVKFIIQKIFQHKKKEVLAFQTEKAAINDLKQLLKSVGKAILLVLDDVWSKSVVQKFKFNLPNYKILVTSRCVFPQIGISYQLKPLNDEAAMILFRSSVIIEGAAIPSPSSHIPQVPAKPESLPMKCQWQKGKLIGRGTFGSVYVASNRETGALCAMKEVEMFPDDPKSAECMKQLEQEIKVLSNLKHPNIVQYYGSEIVEDKFYIYLEYVHPGSINKYVREHYGAMPESIVRNFTRHILSGLAYLHSKRTIHRDIKGANLLVDGSGVVKLADFGLAKHLTGQAADLSLKGSPHWIAPELINPVMQRGNNSDLALAVDIWSLGCTIIEMYTGNPPWSEFEWAAAMCKTMMFPPPIPQSLSAEAKDFLRCCFQRNPADRPLASELLEHRFLKNSQQHPDVPSSYILTSRLLVG